MKMCPAVGSMSRLIIRRVVVLPQPDGPTSTQISPSTISSVRASTATFPVSYCLVTASSEIMRYQTTLVPKVGTSPCGSPPVDGR